MQLFKSRVCSSYIVSWRLFIIIGFLIFLCVPGTLFTSNVKDHQRPSPGRGFSGVVAKSQRPNGHSVSVKSCLTEWNVLFVFCCRLLPVHMQTMDYMPPFLTFYVIFTRMMVQMARIVGIEYDDHQCGEIYLKNWHNYGVITVWNWYRCLALPDGSAQGGVCPSDTS